MIRHIRNVLQPDELERLVALAQVVRFADGRMTNPDTSVKNNLQVPQNDPLATEPGVLVRDALMRNAELRAFALPKQMARPTMARYEPGMNYGWHVDEALFPSTPPMRSDLSCTVWLSPPGAYDGGELVIELGQQTLSFKGEAGDAILYPSTTIHQVTPVTRGARLVAITWLQSWIADASRRELLLQVAELRDRELAGAKEARALVLLESLRTNLFRMWSDT
ncbi:MAG TPA: Fe2+-dependent dioxygenase [Candidatus Saccharimonadia bacterium]|nr:Fe2+-dependent dioxygenase [Candidatus Saccharimonadia bacterium]